eukprot:TRINITY_DN4231_c0_g1_i1.p1 TRINITY_DN4231_c0_g1~~TRINITY_DN4231_c0_g1_i1.p1  ORF type:complete len:382 (-),score=45.57 TRINITY_DN4231_c0_g1_i1:66-1211(-)
MHGIDHWDLFSVPKMKALTHGVMRVAFICFYTHCVFDGVVARGGISFQSTVLFVWGVGYAQVEYRQFNHVGRNLKAYLADFWNIIDFLHLSILLAAILISWMFSHDSRRRISPLERTLEVVHSLNLLPCTLRAMQNFQYSEYFGVLLMTIFEMCCDAMYFFVLLATFCFTMSLALTPILYSGEERAGVGITWSLWSIFGDIPDAAWKRAESLPMLLRCLTMFLLYVLALGSNVLLANLLIALMNNTYTRYQEASKTHWSYSQAEAVLEFDKISPLPSPLNLFSKLLFLVRCKLHSCLGQDTTGMVVLEFGHVGYSPAQKRSKVTFNKKHLREIKRKVATTIVATVKLERGTMAAQQHASSPGETPVLFHDQRTGSSMSNDN